MDIIHLLFPRICLGCTKEGKNFCEKCEQRLGDFRLLTGVCVFCGSATNGQCCAACRKQIGIDDLVVGISFERPAVRELIHAWKFQGLKDLTAPLAQLIIPALKNREPSLAKKTVIIPTPMPWIRRRLRGYNQAELLADELAKELSLVTDHSVLRRRLAPQQSKMRSLLERATNVQNIFYCHAPEKISGKHILLVDDLTTSGQTVSAAASALKTAGAVSIIAAVIAKG